MKPMKHLRYLAVIAALGCAAAAFLLVFISAAAPSVARLTPLRPTVERIGDAERHPAERPFDALTQARAHIAANFPVQSAHAPVIKRSLSLTAEHLASYGLSVPAGAANGRFTVVVFEGPFDVSNAGPGISFASARYIALVYDINGRQLSMTHISAEGAGLEKLISGTGQ